MNPLTDQSIKVSVIIASYNYASLLRDRIEGLLSQTYKNIEIIIVDDCSTDGSNVVLKEYMYHAKIRTYFNENNIGWVRTSNRGAELADGEYLIFANCDDLCDATLVETLLFNILSNPTAGMAFCQSDLIDEIGRKIGDDYVIRERAFRHYCATTRVIEGAQMYKFLLYSCVSPNLSGIMINKEVFFSKGGFSEKYTVCADWNLFFEISASNDTVYINSPLNKFRQHSNSIRSSTKNRIIYSEYLLLLLTRITDRNLSYIERSRFRTRAMYLWSEYILSSSKSGFLSIPYHFKIVKQCDLSAMAFLPLAIVLRLCWVVQHISNRCYERMKTYYVLSE